MNINSEINLKQYVNLNINKIYLHIGLPKTASSSIQATLCKNVQMLTKYDIYYPSNLGNGNHSTPICSMFCQNPKTYFANVRANRDAQEVEEFNARNKLSLLKQISKTLCKSVLISGEGIAMLDFKGVSKLKKFLNDAMPNASIKIIVCVRERCSFITSAVQQRTKEGSSLELINLQSYTELYKSRLEKFKEIFDIKNIIIYKFEDAVKHEKGPVGYFLEKIDINSNKVLNSKILKTNEGVSDKAIEIISYINNRIPLMINAKIGAGRQIGDTNLIQNVRGSKFILPPDIVLKVLDDGKEDTHWLKDTFSIEYQQVKTNMKKPSQIVYDTDYCDDVISFYPKISDILKRLVYEFFKDKIDTVTNQQGKENILRLIEYIEINYSSITEHTIIDLIADFKKVKELCVNSKSQLSKKLNIISDVQNADFYREVALFLEKHNHIEASLYLMEMAKVFRPNGSFIVEKCEEYKQNLEVSKLAHKQPNEYNIYAKAKKYHSQHKLKETIERIIKYLRKGK